jgi:hypothetical protein
LTKLFKNKTIAEILENVEKSEDIFI